MHDIADLEKRGIPGVMIASNAFVSAAADQAKSLGVSPAAVWVQHPIQDRTDKEMRDIADQAVDAIVAALTDGAEADIQG